MAKMVIKLPEDFLLQVSKLAERTDAVLPEVLQAGAEVIETKVKGNLASVIGKGTATESRSTGELLSSLGVSGVKLDKNGNHNIKIGFAEPRSDGGSNAMLANILEYGKHGQPPKPFFKPAITASKSGCIAAMKAKLEEVLK